MLFTRGIIKMEMKALYAHKKYEKNACNPDIHTYIYTLSTATLRYGIYRENLYIHNLGKIN